MAYLSLLVTVLDAQSVHGPDDGCQGLDGVAVDRLVLLHIFAREAVFMDDPRGKPHSTSDDALASPDGAADVRRPSSSSLLLSNPGPASWLSWLEVWSSLDAELLSCCGGTTVSEGKIYRNY